MLSLACPPAAGVLASSRTALRRPDVPVAAASSAEEEEKNSGSDATVVDAHDGEVSSPNEAPKTAEIEVSSQPGHSRPIDIGVPRSEPRAGESADDGAGGSSPEF